MPFEISMARRRGFAMQLLHQQIRIKQKAQEYAMLIITNTKKVTYQNY